MINLDNNTHNNVAAVENKELPAAINNELPPASQKMKQFGKLLQDLHGKYQNIQNKASGFVGFFRQIFSTSLKNEKWQLAQDIDTLSQEFLAFDKELQTSASSLPLGELTEFKLEVDKLKQLVEKVEIPKESLPPASEAPLHPASAVPPPSVGGKGPPPPPMMKKQLTPQEKLKIAMENHLIRENKKLHEKLLIRSNPDNFYIITPPPNEKALRERKMDVKELIKDFNTLNEIDHPVNHQIAEKNLKKYGDELSKIKQQLSGTLSALKKNSTEFQERVKQLRNDELKTIICIFYEGKPPSFKNVDSPSDAEKTAHNLYLTRKTLLDDIFKKWDELQKDPQLKHFLDHQLGWKSFIQGTSILGFLEVMENRALPITHSNHLKEPVYVPAPYKQAAIAGPKPIVQNPAKAAGMTVEEELALKFSKRQKAE